MSITDDSAPEHRFLTVMFCDMVDSTGHVFSMDAEHYAALLSSYRHVVFSSVRGHGGTVARLIGDGVLAYFGWPQATGRDAQSAVACALEITAAIPALDAAVAVSVRIAVETGWVLVGSFGGGLGPDAEIEHAGAIGPAPHIAARLQSFARPNGIIAGEATLQLLGKRFLSEPADLAGIRLPMPIAAAHILGEAGMNDPLARLHLGELAAPVGRAGELAALRHRWRLACARQGQVVLLSGEAGVGKSRLLGAFLDEVGDACRIVALFCNASARDSPFHPLIEPLRRVIGLDQMDNADRIRQRVTEFTRRMALPEDPHEVALATLLGVPPVTPPPPTELRRHIHETLLALVHAMVRESPLVIVAEDVHWADASTLDFLRTLADWVQSTQLLLVITHRSDHVMPWPDPSHVLRLALSPLSAPDAEALAEAISVALGVALQGQQRAEIISRAEGVPLFIEEFVRSLAHDGASSSRLPGSVAQLMAARLDQLREARPLAQLAAVLGREASVGLLRTLSGVPNSEFDEHVSRLTDSGLMVRRGAGETAVLAFRHNLFGDAAYGALPNYRRRALHSVVADTLGRVNPSLATSEPEALARHFAAADRTSEANELYRAAAVSALSAGAFIEAETHARKALELAQLLPETDRNEAVLTALAPLGEALIATRGYADLEVQEVFERGARLALAMGTAREMLPLLRGLTSFYQVRGPLSMARRLGERVLQIARVLGEPLLLAQAERRHGWCRMCEGNLAEARLLLDTALARQTAVSDADASKDFVFDDATTLGTLAWLDWLTDGKTAALTRARNTEARAASSPRPLSAAYAFGFAAITHQLAGDTDGAERLAIRCGAIAAARGIVYWTAMAEALRGWSEALRDRSPNGVNRLRRAIADYHRTQSEILRPYLLGLLADAEYATGSSEAGREALDLGERLAVDIGARVHLPILLLLRGRMRQGVESRQALSAAQDEALSQGATAVAAVAQALLGRRR